MTRFAISVAMLSLLAAPAVAEEVHVYDALGRLAGITRATGGDSNFSNYSYDEAGNRLFYDAVYVPSLGAGYALQSGETLTLGQSLVSQDTRFELKFETTGRLILYFGSTVLWEASQEWWFSEVPQPTALVMQPDGNAVIYNPNWQPLWATGTSGNFGAALVLQDDGNLVLYDASSNPIWDSGTCCH